MYVFSNTLRQASDISIPRLRGVEAAKYPSADGASAVNILEPLTG